MIMTFFLSDQIYVITGKMTYPGSNKSGLDGSFLRNHKTLAKKNKKKKQRNMFFLFVAHIQESSIHVKLKCSRQSLVSTGYKPGPSSYDLRPLHIQKKFSNEFINT